jgi:hypothetical protein
MAIIAITGPPDVLGKLPTLGSSFPLAVVPGTADDNGDGTWTVTGHTAEENIPALTTMGCTVRIAVTDSDELAQWEAQDAGEGNA